MDGSLTKRVSWPPGARLSGRLITYFCRRGPITETKVKAAGITTDQRRWSRQEYVKRTNQTHNEAGPLMNLLGFKHVTRIGTWNVATPFESDRPKQAAREMNRYTVGIPKLGEVRWTTFGLLSIASPVRVYSGPLRVKKVPHERSRTYARKDS